MSIAYRNLYILAFGVFAVLNTELGIVGILPQLAEVTGKSISQVGYLISMFAVTVTFIGPIFTVLALRLNQKMALILAQLLLLLTNILPLLFPNYTIMMIARFLGGLGHPLFFTLALSYPAYTMPAEKQTQAMAIILGGVNVAFIIGFPLISFVATTFAWQAGFIFSILMNLLAMIGVILCIPKTMPNKLDSKPLSLTSFKDKGFIISIPVLVLSFTGMFSMYSYFSPYLKQMLFVQPQDLTLALVCFGTFGLIGNILTGFISPKKTSTAFIIYLILFMTNYLLLSTTTITLPTLLLVSTWGFLQSGMILLGQIWFTMHKTADIEAVNSMLVSSSNLGITLGSFLGGVVISSFGLNILPFFGMFIVFMVIMGVLLNSKICKNTSKVI